MRVLVGIGLGCMALYSVVAMAYAMSMYWDAAAYEALPIVRCDELASVPSRGSHVRLEHCSNGPEEGWLRMPGGVHLLPLLAAPGGPVVAYASIDQPSSEAARLLTETSCSVRVSPESVRRSDESLAPIFLIEPVDHGDGASDWWFAFVMGPFWIGLFVVYVVVLRRRRPSSKAE